VLMSPWTKSRHWRSLCSAGSGTCTSIAFGWISQLDSLTSAYQRDQHPWKEFTKWLINVIISTTELLKWDFKIRCCQLTRSVGCIGRQHVGGWYWCTCRFVF
jgi:hypothetical protein